MRHGVPDLLHAPDVADVGPREGRGQVGLAPGPRLCSVWRRGRSGSGRRSPPCNGPPPTPSNERTPWRSFCQKGLVYCACRAGASSKPNCCIKPSESYSELSSTTLPSAIRWMTIDWTSMGFPVGGVSLPNFDHSAGVLKLRTPCPGWVLLRGEVVDGQEEQAERDAEAVHHG